MSDAMRVDQQQGVGADLLYSERRSGRQEPSVLDFLNSLSNAEDKRSVDE